MKGTARISSVPGLPLAPGVPDIVAESTDIPDDVWVDLDRGGKLTAKHPRSTRETTFTGPSRFRSCVGHGEETWVASGKFESVPSSGERPGAEEWVVTPTGVIRYGSTNVEINVTAGTATTVAKTEIKVTGGTAYAWTGEQASPVKPPEVAADHAMLIPEGWIRLEGTRSVTLSQKKAGKADEAAKAAVDRCITNAKAAKDLATAVASPDASLANLAPKHVVARHLARAACDVALLEVGLLEASPVRDGFYATLKDAETDWKAIRSRGGRGRRP